MNVIYLWFPQSDSDDWTCGIFVMASITNVYDTLMKLWTNFVTPIDQTSRNHCFVHVSIHKK
jgi:hypothetical protein